MRDLAVGLAKFLGFAVAPKKIAGPTPQMSVLGASLTLQTRERPPAQLQEKARTSNLRDIGGFASIWGDFMASRGTRRLNGQRASAPAIAREASISQFLTILNFALLK